jgi:hypothetical protein
MHTKIANWSAKRAGAGMTVTGIDGNHGGDVKVVQVEEITVDDTGRILATIKGGDRVHLMAARQPRA